METGVIISMYELDFLVMFLIVIGFCVTTLTDQWQLIKKVQGGLKSSVAAGYNAAMKMMVLNRFGAVMYFSASAFYIESSGSPSGLVQIYCFALFITLMSLVAGTLYYFKKSVLVVDFSGHRSFAAASLFANAFGALGLTAPLIAGVVFLEYRLLLSNSSFLLNTIYTFIMVFYLEAKMAKLIDMKSESIRAVAFAIITGRIMGYFLISLLYLYMVLYEF